MQTWLQLAHLPYRKALAQGDFAAQLGVDERRIRELASRRFLAHGDDLLFLGPLGVGKTHVAIGVAMAAIESGHSTDVSTVADLLARLGKVFVERRLDQHGRVYTEPGLLISAELG